MLVPRKRRDVSLCECICIDLTKESILPSLFSVFDKFGYLGNLWRELLLDSNLGKHFVVYPTGIREAIV